MSKPRVGHGALLADSQSLADESGGTGCAAVAGAANETGENVRDMRCRFA